MATYTPFDYTSSLPMAGEVGGYGDFNPAETATEHSLRQQADVSSKFRDYAGTQFKGLFDMANAQPTNPLSGLAGIPRYSPYSGTRGDFTTPSYGGYGIDPSDGSIGEWMQYPAQFDQKGYLDARFGNINDYLGQMGSFLGNMGSGGHAQANANVAQAAVQRAIQQANMPQVGAMPTAGVPAAGGSGGLGGFANYGGWGGRQATGGWGTHPVAGGLLGFGGE